MWHGFREVRYEQGDTSWVWDFFSLLHHIFLLLGDPFWFSWLVPKCLEYNKNQKEIKIKWLLMALPKIFRVGWAFLWLEIFEKFFSKDPGWISACKYPIDFCLFFVVVVVVEWSCTHKWNKSVRTLNSGQMVVHIALAKIPEWEGTISPSSFYGQLLDY